MFFQAEDGIRDLTVTGVQTCALPITTPAAGSAIEADTADGINTALVDIDRTLRSKVLGGMSRKSNQVGFEALLDDSGYECLIVQCFGIPFNGHIRNTTPSRGVMAVAAGSFHGSPATLPYVTANTDDTISRRVI